MAANAATARALRALPSRTGELSGMASTPAARAAALNVPGVAEAAAALRAGGSPRDTLRALVDASRRLTAAGARAAADFALPPDGPLATRVHSEVYTHLRYKARRLADGGFLGNGTFASSTLLGPRGTGKSVAMRTFAAVAQLSYPSVVPVVVDFAAERGPASRALADVVVEALNEAGVPAPIGGGVGGAVDALAAAGKSALLLVDELDALYAEGRADFASRAVDTLWCLLALGNNPRGRIATVLCGSSATLTELVTANAKTNPAMRERFPLLQYAPNLNGQKFRSQRMWADGPTSLAAVGDIMLRPLSGPALAAAERRVVCVTAFVAGATARSVLRFRERFDGDPGSLERVAEIVGGLREQDVTQQAEARVTLEPDGALARTFDAICDALWKRNAPLMGRLVDRRTGAVAFDAVADGAWAAEFHPLSWDNVASVLKKRGLDPARAYADVAHLADRDYIAIAGDPSAIYPFSLWSLACSRSGAGTRRGAMEAFASAIHANLPSLGTLAQNLANGVLLWNTINGLR